jgi:hypothetical protein
VAKNEEMGFTMASVEKTMEIERQLVDAIRTNAKEFGYTLETHKIQTNEIKGDRIINLKVTRAMKSQGELPLSFERTPHPDNIPE